MLHTEQVFKIYFPVAQTLLTSMQHYFQGFLSGIHAINLSAPQHGNEMSLPLSTYPGTVTDRVSRTG